MIKKFQPFLFLSVLLNCDHATNSSKFSAHINDDWLNQTRIVFNPTTDQQSENQDDFEIIEKPNIEKLIDESDEFEVVSTNQQNLPFIEPLESFKHTLNTMMSFIDSNRYSPQNNWMDLIYFCKPSTKRIRKFDDFKNKLLQNLEEKYSLEKMYSESLLFKASLKYINSYLNNNNLNSELYNLIEDSINLLNDDELSYLYYFFMNYNDKSFIKFDQIIKSIHVKYFKAQ